jgi:MFS family permease
MGIDDQQLGILYSVSNIANLFMVLLAGVIVDKFGLRRSAFAFNLLVAIGGICFCLGLGPYKSYYLLVAGRFLFG